jgi:gamma-glutamyl:cysteine ligase YbdK (ATP-grasp superfamily)
MKLPSLTIGVEEEYQIIDPETRALQSYITQILEADHLILGQVKPELHQSIAEVGTTVCRTPQEEAASMKSAMAAAPVVPGPTRYVTAQYSSAVSSFAKRKASPETKHPWDRVPHALDRTGVSLDGRRRC